MSVSINAGVWDSLLIPSFLHGRALHTSSCSLRARGANNPIDAISKVSYCRSMALRTTCPERLALLIAYQQAIQDYSVAVDDLHKKSVSAEEEEFQELSSKAGAMRLQAQKAADAYHKHRKDHGC